jgi:hypothetical protein
MGETTPYARNMTCQGGTRCDRVRTSSSGSERVQKLQSKPSQPLQALEHKRQRDRERVLLRDRPTQKEYLMKKGVENPVGLFAVGDTHLERENTEPLSPTPATHRKQH